MQCQYLQFRLRTLLGCVVLLCIGFGVWSLYWTYFGPYVEADPVVAGQPIKVHGRFMDFLGDESTHYVLTISKPKKKGGEFLYQTQAGQALRRGLWVYEFQIQLQPVSPGAYVLRLYPVTKAARTAPKETPRPDVLYGKITVLPSDE